jgi:putative ubiquitin-RnfH superfamily antitoxin RatB of RatAB toxin-antitoxin module
MRVEIAFALPERQELLEVDVEVGATVDDVITASDLCGLFPGQDFAALQAGIWGKVVARDQVVREGDRVELYRPLEIDPKEARRLKVGR